MIDKNRFYECLSVFEISHSEKFDLLYNAAVCSAELDDPEAFTTDILKLLFPSAADPLIPLSFWSTELGKAIMTVRYNYEDVFLVSDLAEITGTLDRNITKAARKGTLKGEHRGGTWVFYRNDVKKYFKYLNNRKK